jgi:dienelactone hydrolase
VTRAAAAAAALLVFGLAFCGAAVARGPSPSLFAYDASRPLDVRFERQETYAARHRFLTFDAGYGERLNAIYITPLTGGGPWPVVLFSPGSRGGEYDQLPDGDTLAKRGIASLTVATPGPLVTCNARKDIRTYANYVISRRRALDVIATLPNADATRVAAVGFSFGAAVTGTLVGVDHRLKAAVIQSGRAHLSSALGSLSCSYLDKRKRSAYVSAFSVVDPVNYVRSAGGAALLFQNGTQDPISPRKDVVAYVRAASAPKEQRWYKAGHLLTTGAMKYRDAWLVRRILPS